MYRDQLGGLGGSVARAAEAVLASQPASAEGTEADLRRAFLSLVRVNPEGQFARRPSVWDDLPVSVHPILERFVLARLLVSGQRGSTRTLEVAHESLFRSWGKLRAWLQEDREFLLWRERLRGSLTEWEHSRKDEGALLRGAVLTEAVTWTTQRPGQLAADERAFIEASSELRQRERRAAEAQRERELEQAKERADEQRKRADQEARSGRKLRRLVFGLVALIVGVAAALMFAWRAQRLEAEARSLAIARQLATEATSALDRSDGTGAHLRTSLLLAVHRVAPLLLDRRGIRGLVAGHAALSAAAHGCSWSRGGAVWSGDFEPRWTSPGRRWWQTDLSAGRPYSAEGRHPPGGEDQSGGIRPGQSSCRQQ